MFIQQPHLALPPEAEVRNPTIHKNLSNQTASATPHVDPISTTTVHVPVNIAFDPVRRSRIRHGEYPPVDEKGAIIDDDDIESVDRRSTRGIRRAVPVNKVRVGDVHYLLARREADAVRPPKAVRDNTDVAAFGIEAVYLLRQLRWGPEALLVAVDGVGEPDAAVRVDDDVVRGVELSAVVVVEQRRGLVGPFSFHVDEPARFVQRALSAEENAIAVVDAAVGHVVALWTSDFVTGEVFGAEEFDLGNEDSFIGRADCAGVFVGDLVGCDEECVGLSMEDAGFVEE